MQNKGGNIMPKYSDIKSEAIYSEKSGKFLGWQLSWVIITDYYDIDASRFFKETWFRNSHRAMCRFQRKLLKRNENTK